MKNSGRVIQGAQPDFSNLNTAVVKPSISSQSRLIPERRIAELGSMRLLTWDADACHFEPISYHSRHFDRGDAGIDSTAARSVSFADLATDPTGPFASPGKAH